MSQGSVSSIPLNSYWALDPKADDPGLFLNSVT